MKTSTIPPKRTFWNISATFINWKVIDYFLDSLVILKLKWYWLQLICSNWVWHGKRKRSAKRNNRLIVKSNKTWTYLSQGQSRKFCQRKLFLFSEWRRDQNDAISSDEEHRDWAFHLSVNLFECLVVDFHISDGFFDVSLENFKGTLKIRK